MNRIRTYAGAAYGFSINYAANVNLIMYFQVDYAKYVYLISNKLYLSKLRQIGGKEENFVGCCIYAFVCFVGLCMVWYGTCACII